MSRWSVYSVQGRLTDGTHVPITDKTARRWFVRWRVDGASHRRTFKQKGYAKTFHQLLCEAALRSWACDERGWPVDPATPSPTALGTAPRRDDDIETDGDGTDGVGASHTVESYVREVWWPTLSATLGDKNRLGHRRNAEVAVQLLRYGATPGDRRGGPGRGVGDSIRLADLTSDDLKSAVVRRRDVNGRVAAVNRRRLTSATDRAAAAAMHSVDVDLEPERASTATIYAFATTLGMIVTAAIGSEEITGNPMDGVKAFAPKPKPARVGLRLVPSVNEVFDLADAIATLGPRMADGRPTGERFRSLILAAGTLGPRPGELVAHRPEWVVEAGPTLFRFAATEAAVYDTVEGSPGRRERQLKHREVHDVRDVPVQADVRAAILTHIERGYGSTTRTWLSPTGRGHLDWGNLRDTYWRPALRLVFDGTSKAGLVTAPPKILRKAAITWWLETGVSPTVAGEWAGHTEEVLQLYYASQNSVDWATEAALLQRARGLG